MALSTGKTAIELEFDNGNKSTIYIDIHDRGIRERIAAFGQKVDQRIKSIDSDRYKTVFDGEDLRVDSVDELMDMDPEKLEMLQNRLDAIMRFEDEYNTAIKEELDEVFRSKVSKEVFKYCEPFDVVTTETGKEMYVMHFLKWFAKEIERLGNGNNEAMQKYLKRYDKK